MSEGAANDAAGGGEDGTADVTAEKGDASGVPSQYTVKDAPEEAPC